MADILPFVSSPLIGTAHTTALPLYLQGCQLLLLPVGFPAHKDPSKKEV